MSAHFHAIFQNRCASIRVAFIAQRNAMPERDILANSSIRVDHQTIAMVNAKPLTNFQIPVQLHVKDGVGDCPIKPQIWAKKQTIHTLHLIYMLGEAKAD